MVGGHDACGLLCYPALYAGALDPGRILLGSGAWVFDALVAGA